MSSTTKPVVGFAIATAWVQDVILELKPPELDVVFFERTNTEESTAVLPTLDFLVTTHVPAAWVPLLTKCRLVQQLGVGYDTADRQGLHDAGILLTNTPPLTAEGVAEHTLMMILALNKLVIPVHESVRRGEFNQFGWRQRMRVFHGSTLGIVGLGRIGRQLARTARGFGVKIIYNDIVPAPSELEEELELTRVSFDEVLTESDVVTSHVPLTDKTRGMFGREQFAQMKQGGVFINNSRGETYSMDDLYQALVSGHLRGAGIDVYEPEPPPIEHPLLHLQNVICTPHLASGTVDRHYAIHTAQFENCLRMMRGEQPHNIIPIEQE